MSEQFQTGLKKPGRGMSRASLDLIAAMSTIAEASQPITGRGVGYKLFTAGLIASTSVNEMQKVYRLLRIAREQGDIPWEWIVDETRKLERKPSWDNPAQFVKCVNRSYRRDFWNQQPVRVEVWSEKGTIRGVLAPVLDHYGVGFRVMHGFSSATSVNDVAESDNDRPLIALYVGDFDPSGLYMSESFPASDKRKDPRHPWFVERHGTRCWEIDAMDPRDLRECTELAIKALIEPVAWARCETVNAAECESLRTVLDSWGTRDG
jgi:hypothetical protein